MSGFQNAPVTKSIMFLLPLMSVTASVFSYQMFCHLTLRPYLTEQYQFWRLISMNLIYPTSLQLLVAMILIYQSSTTLERLLGSSQYISNIIVVTILSACMSLLSLAVLGPLGLRKFHPGPTTLSFFLLSYYTAVIPSAWTINVGGVVISNHALTWLLSCQLAFAYGTSTVIQSLFGVFLAGLIRKSARLRSWRLPLFLQKPIARVFGIFIGKSLPPVRRNIRPIRPAPSTDRRRANQSSYVRDDAAQTQRSRRPGSLQADMNLREFVSSLGSPTSLTSSTVGNVHEQPEFRQIVQQLQAIFPQRTREDIVRVLESTDGDQGRAIESLLSQNETD